MTTAFRSDVEGLRALAVLPIVAFHLNPDWCPGGFIGVDVFFVISGYLITRMILAEGGAFSFRRFYVRRVFRLFPALLTTLAVSLAVGWKLMPPEDYAGLAGSALAAAAGVSNVYFYLTLDYFNDASIYHPLLHTWSLGVEEQFYLIWPALIVLAASRRRTTLAVMGLLGLSVASLFVLDRGIDPSFAFYMMPLRVFEFAAGAALVRSEASWERTAGAGLQLIAGVAGFTLLMLSFWLFSEETPWPGPAALMPTAATALLILAGRSGMWRSILGNPLFRGIGRISYSLYLVHWPVVVFHRYATALPPSVGEALVLAALMILLATAMYFGIETPFRLGKSKGAATRAAEAFWRSASTWPLALTRGRIVGVAAGLFAASGAFIVGNDGVPSRLMRKQVQHSDQGLTFAGDMCSHRQNRCSFGERTSKTIVYVVGDSHALNLIHGLDGLFREAGIHGIAFFDHGCLFARGTATYARGRIDEKCAATVEETFAHIEETAAPVIFALNYLGYRGRSGEHRPGVGPTGPDAYFDWLAKRLQETFAGIGGDERKLVIVRQTYSTGIDLPKCIFSPTQQGKGAPDCTVRTLAEANETSAAADGVVDRLAAAFPHALILNPRTAFCSESGCTVRDGDRLFLRDASHLTNVGSDFLAHAVRETLLGYLSSTR